MLRTTEVARTQNHVLAVDHPPGSSPGFATSQFRGGGGFEGELSPEDLFNMFFGGGMGGGGGFGGGPGTLFFSVPRLSFFGILRLR